MDQPKANILLVEDDVSMGFLLKDNLEMANYQVTLRADGHAVLPTFLDQSFDLCIMDVMLPGKDGFALVSEMRKLDPAIPIIFLTAKNQKEDRVKGFRLGGDDYVTKPFSIEEFLLRVAAVLRRTNGDAVKVAAAKIHRCPQFTFNVENQVLEIGTQKVQLTYRETKLLDLLCRNANQLLNRDTIHQFVWEDEVVKVGRSLDVFVSRLRKYFKQVPSVKITTVHGVGYRFEVPTEPNS